MKASLGPVAMGNWGRVRRFAVPVSMIRQATERRVAGDWRGACAAANVGVTFDLDEVTVKYGAEVAGQVLEDLLVLAPDLARWHMPRYASGPDTIVAERNIVLASYPDGPELYLQTPSSARAPQRLRLAVGSVENVAHLQSWVTSRYLWDATQAHELRMRCGGGTDRAPFFTADGELAELPTADPGTGDPAARTEWLTVLQERGDLEEAFAEAGFEVRTRPTFSDGRPNWTYDVLRTWPFVWSRFADETRGLAERTGHSQFRHPMTYYSSMSVDLRADVPVFAVNVHAASAWQPLLPHVIAHLLPDLDLLRTGRMTPGELHPLVRTSLFPAMPEPEPVPRYTVPLVRVRCQGVWHLIAPRDGVLSGPHTEQEHRREQALQALGGTASGCFRARTAWAEGKQLPKHLHMLRKEIFGRARHGDTAGVIELLDAGIDPRVRDSGKRTLLHYVHLLDHELLLSRLLDVGLDLDAYDHEHRTPLFVAIYEYGSADVVRALVDAGARIDVVNRANLGLRRLITLMCRYDLDFLMTELVSRYPRVGRER
ncbi:ankyrin repeat domain-containing protein [Kibdelosporangium persicum]|uniref:Ankyrin repeat-containing domain-containing protein n=1 Tax=Kibdelosporangium persicum TaxID=2698649 RepID=A0ABX2FD25_9PSEU|nr:ankyrin repeat domain-containing protein [Kibdelosporangium persicum]NRN68810.1 Ankyrin repeat-containing domain-containing protein [Kibdelosporangium persicum]